MERGEKVLAHVSMVDQIPVLAEGGPQTTRLDEGPY